MRFTADDLKAILDAIESLERIRDAGVLELRDEYPVVSFGQQRGHIVWSAPMHKWVFDPADENANA